MDILFFPLSFIITLILVPIFRKIAILLNITDKPSARKIHTKPKPYLGGLAIFVSAVICINIFGSQIFYSSNTKLVIAAFLLVIVGVIDDKFDLPSYLKLGFQFLIAIYASIVVGGISKIEIYSFVFYFNQFQGYLVMTLWLVALINAFNLIDGLDGLAAGTGVISFTTLLIVSFMSNDVSNAPLLYTLIGCLMGFLFYNFYPATIFLGDSGSMLIGFIVGIISLGSYKTVTVTSSILLFLVGFLPILDATLSFVRRKINGQRAFKADALHFHHRLLLHGYSHPQAVFIMYGFMILYAIAGITISTLKILKYKILILLFVIILTIIIIERFYLLSNKYTFFSNLLRFFVNGGKNEKK